MKTETTIRIVSLLILIFIFVAGEVIVYSGVFGKLGLSIMLFISVFLANCLGAVEQLVLAKVKDE